MQRNTRQTLGPPSLDLNVQPAWMQGITGEGVVVSFVDDGNSYRKSYLYIATGVVHLKAAASSKVFETELSTGLCVDHAVLLYPPLSGYVATATQHI